jgi:hypothetical protein
MTSAWVTGLNCRTPLRGRTDPRFAVDRHRADHESSLRDSLKTALRGVAAEASDELFAKIF